MRKRGAYFIVSILALLWMGCEGDGPFNPGEKPLAEAGGAALVDSTLYVSDGGFSIGYSNGNLRSEVITLQWTCSQPEDFLCYKIFAQQQGFGEQVLAQINDFDQSVLVVPNLIQNTWYNFRLERVNRSGMHTGHLIAFKSARWEAPTQLFFNGLAPTIVELSWQDNCDNESNYMILTEIFNSETNQFQLVNSNLMEANTEQANVTLADMNGLYRFGIMAKSAYENDTELIYSSEYSVRFDPATNFHAEQMFDSRIVNLNWVDNSTMETGYELQRSIGEVQGEIDWNTVAVLGTNASSWADTDTSGAVAGDTLYYRLRGLNTYAGITTYTDWTAVQLILQEPFLAPQWEYELWDGQYVDRFLSTNDTDVYLYHALDNIEVYLCPYNLNQDLGFRIWHFNSGVYIGNYNIFNTGDCEISTINAVPGDYLIEIYDSNNLNNWYQLYIR